MDSRFLTLHHAGLILRFTHNTLTEAEKDELDDWICKSDENMLLFEELTEAAGDHLLSEDDIIVATEDEDMNWIVVYVLAQHFRGLLSPTEQKQLFTWARLYGIPQRIFTDPHSASNVAETLLTIMKKVKTRQKKVS